MTASSCCDWKFDRTEKMMDKNSATFIRLRPLERLIDHENSKTLPQDLDFQPKNLLKHLPTTAYIVQSNILKNYVVIQL